MLRIGKILGNILCCLAVSVGVPLSLEASFGDERCPAVAPSSHYLAISFVLPLYMFTFKEHLLYCDSIHTLKWLLIFAVPPYISSLSTLYFPYLIATPDPD